MGLFWVAFNWTVIYWIFLSFKVQEHQSVRPWIDYLFWENKKKRLIFWLIGLWLIKWLNNLDTFSNPLLASEVIWICIQIRALPRSVFNCFIFIFVVNLNCKCNFHITFHCPHVVFKFDFFTCFLGQQSNWPI